jgi:glutamine synthetase
VVDPVLQQPYSRDPRYVAKKAENYLRQTGIATTCYFGPELEFFIFDSIRFGQDQHCGYYYVESAEGDWNTGRDEGAYGGGNLGYKQRYKEGYFPVPPHDTLQEIRSEIALTLQQAGVQIEVHHHEVATAGQNEIDMRFATLTRMADNVMIYKYVCKNVARRRGKVATFMPKPLFADNASGMHCHQSLWKDGQNLFYDATGWALTSELCRWYIGGLLKHAPALMAFCAPTTNSYKRLVPGYEAPVNLAMSQRNRSAAARIPMYSASPNARRVEFRCPDPSANAYLAFAAMLMAGLDGIENRTDPGDPLDRNIYDLPPQEASKIRQVPGSLEASLAALEADDAFLRKGDVFTDDVIQTWIDYKRKREIDPIKLRPHPWEFYLYFDT